MGEQIERDYHGDEIAVIGMAGHFSRASDVEQFWRNVRDGVECVSFFSDEELLEAGHSPEEIASPGYVKAKGILEGTEMFDAAFFGFSPREAEIMDPQTRHFLEVAWTAMEHAGYDADQLDAPVAVYAGGASSSYMLYHAMTNPAALFALGGMQASLLTGSAFIPTWTAYKLNLRGPAVAVNTACSTALVAIHMGAQSLLNGECTLALAGGVAISTPTVHGYGYDEGGIASDDGHTRSFDAAAKGTVTGSAAGAVILKRLDRALEDGDTVYAVIRGSAINNDGSFKIGFTAPSVDGQAEVIAEAQAIAGIKPDTVGMIECHGSATPLGDPIEVAALTQAFKGSGAAPRSVAIGSVKSNLGHTDTAAGVSGFIKTVQALRHRQIPPSLHFTTPNPQIDFAAGPFYVNTELRPWETDGTPRRAGVSSFGIGGTNAHIILEEAPEAEPTDDRPWQLVTLSARTATALETATRNLVAHLRAEPDANLADVAWTLQAGRRMFAHRRVATVRDVADAAQTLSTLNPGRVATAQGEPGDHPVVFVFPGESMGTAGLGAELYRDEPVFREAVDACGALLRPRLGVDLPALVYAEGEDAVADANDKLAHSPALGAPAAFLQSYALARLWMHWGVEPESMLGHGVGEYVAACLSGVLSLEEAVGLAAERGRLMDTLPAGAWYVVGRPEAEMRPLLGDDAVLVSVEGPAVCLVSATAGAAALEARLEAAGVAAQKIPLDHAWDATGREAIARALGEYAARLRPGTAEIPFVSGTTGTWMTAADAADPQYWARQLRAPVRFADALTQLFTDSTRILLEMGPGMLTGTMRAHPARDAAQATVAALARGMGESDRAALLKAVGALWLAGRRTDWAALRAGERRRRVPLPTYPFERRAFWLGHAPGTAPQPSADEAERMQQAAAEATRARHPRPNLQVEFVAPRDERETAIVAIWEELFGIAPIGVLDNFFELGGHSLLGTQVVSRVRAALEVELPVRVLFEGPTVAELAAAVERGEGSGGAADVIGRADAGGDAADLLARLDELSEEEMEALLAQMQDEGN